MILTWEGESLDTAKDVTLIVNVESPLEGFREMYEGGLQDGNSAKEFIKKLISYMGMENFRRRTVRTDNYALGPPDEEVAGKAVYRVHFPEEPEPLREENYLKKELEDFLRVKEKRFYIASRDKYVDEPSYRSFHGEKSLFAESDYPKGDFAERLMQFEYELGIKKGREEQSPIMHSIIEYLTYGVANKEDFSIEGPSGSEERFEEFLNNKLKPVIDEYLVWQHNKENFGDFRGTISELQKIRGLVEEFKNECNIENIYKK